MANNQVQLPQDTIVDKKYPYFYFTSVNRRVNEVLAKDEEMRDLVNWHTTQVGAKQVRPGLKKFLNQADSQPVTGLFYVKFSNASIGKRLIRLSGNKFYAVDPTFPGLSGWGVSLFTITNPWVRPDAAVLDGLIHIVTKVSDAESHYIEYNGADTPIDTNYTSGADPVSPYKAKTCVQYHRRIYVGNSYDGTNNFKSDISYSGIDYIPAGDPSTPWTTEVSVTDPSKSFTRPIDRDYNGDIIKLTNVNDRVLIYKEEGLYAYNETSVAELFGLSAYDGSIATMRETKENYFFTNEGFFKTDGANPPSPVGPGWYNIIKQILHNGIDVKKIVSGSCNFKYYCYMGDVTYDSKTVPNAMFVYDAMLDEMWLWSMGPEITCISYFVNNSNDKIPVFGDANGNTYTLDNNQDTDDGVQIQAELTMSYRYFDDPTKFNWLRRVFGVASPGAEIDILADKDFRGQYAQIGKLDGYFEKRKIDFARFGQFKFLSIKFVWSGGGKRPTLYGAVVEVKQGSEHK